MKTARAKASWLAETGVRLDAGYHLSEGRQARLLVERSPGGWATLGAVTKRIFNGPRFKRYYVQDAERGIPFMGNSDMLKADVSNLKLISKKHTRSLAELWLEKDWTLISCSGTIGNTVFTTAEFEGKTASQHIMRVVPDTEKIPAGYLYAFLASKYGRGLLTQGTYGAVIQHIEPQHIAELPVPLLSEAEMRRIGNMVQEAGRLRVMAQELRGGGGNSLIINSLNAEKLLSEPKEIIRKVQVGSIHNSYSLRLEANYYAGLSEKIMAHFTAHGIATKRLEEVAARIFRPGIFKRVFVQKGVPFLGGGEMMEANPKPEKQLSPRRTPNLPGLMLEKYWTLITCGGTIGNTIFTHEGHAQMAASQHVLRVVAGDEMPAGYLHAYLASPIGKAFITDYTYGSVIPQIEPHHLRRMPVPVLPAALQQEIHEKLVRATDAMHQANQLENEAIHLVESAIAAWQ
jgi:type I restriction enzyme, S subunit